MAWIPGHITVEGQTFPALVKRRGNTLRIETEGEIVAGQTFNAFDITWEAVEVELTAAPVRRFASCVPAIGSVAAPAPEQGAEE